MAIADRVDGPVRLNPFTIVNLPRETVERFLELFSSCPEELTPAPQKAGSQGKRSRYRPGCCARRRGGGGPR